MKNKIKDKIGFKLKSITLKDSSEFESSSFQFIQDEFVNNSSLPFTTLVIGPNGTGKSRLLRVIIDIFNDLYNFKHFARTSFRFDQYYNLQYYLNGMLYEIENNREAISISVKVDGKLQNSAYSFELPTRGIAAAYSLFEKFSPKETSYLIRPSRSTRYDNDFYEYLGIKTTRNYTFSSANINNSIDRITEALAEKGFEKDLKSVFNVLGFLPKLSISYEVKRNKELFSGSITTNNFKQNLEEIKYRSAGFSYSSIQNLKEATEEEIERVVVSLNKASKFLGSKLKLPIELSFDNKSDSYFENIYTHLSTLRKLNLVNYDKIMVYKKMKNNPDGAEIELRSMSSGEIQILTSLLSLASVVKESSIVLIDEPEISLHPNWQMQYIDLLNKIFKKQSSCHFIIATHSHLLAADIPIDSSSILSLTRNNKLELVSELLDSTFGNSAENILYNVFGVATVRNIYFEGDINKLLKLISNKSKKKNEIESLLLKFKRFKISPNDPLNVIIKDAEKYLQKI